MTIKIMAFLVKRHYVTNDELIEHYESRHVPLILSLDPPPLTYRRNFLRLEDTRAAPELVFADRQTYADWVSAMYAPDSGVAEDEARFLDRSKTRSCVVEAHST